MSVLAKWVGCCLAFGLTGCASFPQSNGSVSTPEGQRLLESAANAHGLAAYRRLRDISVSYDGEWSSLVNRLQPALVDSNFRGKSEERLLVAAQSIGQIHSGPGGVKVVKRTPESVAVAYNNIPESDPEKGAAAALVADGYRLFLLGPIYLAERKAIVEVMGTDVIDGQEYDKLFARIRPGLGEAREDRVMLWIDRRNGLTRRLWMSADGLPSTQGVIAEIELDGYIASAGVRWPTRFIERLKRPFPLDVHRWRLTGLDVDRGFDGNDLSITGFAGPARAPAKPFDAAP